MLIYRFQMNIMFFLKIKGVEELDNQLKEIIFLNQKLAIENGKLKIQYENILAKYKDIFNEKKKIF